MIYYIIIFVLSCFLLYFFILPVLDLFQSVYKHGYLSKFRYYSFIVIFIVTVFSSSFVFSGFIYKFFV